MMKIKTILGLIAAISLTLTMVAPAADAKVYKTDGSIIRLSGTMFLLRTAGQDVEVLYDSKTKINGKLAKSSGVTVVYERVAGEVHAVEVTMPTKK